MTLELVLNQDKIVPRKAYGVRDEQTASVRYSYYVTKDERLVLFMAPEEKFWDNFLRGLGREDLKTTYPPTYKLDHQPGDEGLRQELIKIFATRTQEEWVRFCIEHNVPCGPVHEAHEILSDPHFIARDNVYEVVQPETGAIKLLGTPIKVEAEEFSANPSPMLGQHTDEVLREILEYDDDQVAAIHRSITLAE
jgi:crotonobetainyl-CoA:carnitine CoA-transferase CaiB-like acyl-CoA transferase